MFVSHRIVDRVETDVWTVLVQLAPVRQTAADKSDGNRPHDDRMGAGTREEVADRLDELGDGVDSYPYSFILPVRVTYSHVMTLLSLLRYRCLDCFAPGTRVYSTLDSVLSTSTALGV